MPPSGSPAAPSAGATYAPAPTDPNFGAPAKRPGGNGLAITSLILGIVAILGFAVPVLNVFSALLAVVGLVLGVIAFIRKAGSRGLSLSGTIVSGLALLLSVIFIVIYAVGLSAAIDEVSSDDPAVVETPVAESEAEPAAPADEEAEEPAASDVGTRENPAPIGTTIEVSSFDEVIYEVTLGQPVLNANDAVAGANQFNEPAEAGFQYALVPVNVTYVGSETGTPWIDLAVEYVSAAGSTHTQADSPSVAPEPTMMSINEMYNGSTATGNIVIMIPTEGAAGGAWTVSALFGDPFFFAAE